MANLIQPSQVKVVTNNGEVTVHLTIDLNLNLNQNGSIGVSEDSSDRQVTSFSKPKKKDDDDKVMWEVPDFKPSEKLKFGK